MSTIDHSPECREIQPALSGTDTSGCHIDCPARLDAHAADDAEPVTELPPSKPPERLSVSLGLAQQSWHMADAACKALGLPFEETSPTDIFNAIIKLQRDSKRLRAQRKAR